MQKKITKKFSVLANFFRELYCKVFQNKFYVAYYQQHKNFILKIVFQKFCLWYLQVGRIGYNSSQWAHVTLLPSFPPYLLL